MPEPTGAPAPDPRETPPPTRESEPVVDSSSAAPDPREVPPREPTPVVDDSSAAPGREPGLSTAEDSPQPAKPAKPGSPGREVHCGDALAWLAGRSPIPAASFVTSLPDVCEVPMTFPAWRAWFIDAAAAVLRATPPEGVAIFYQTDIKHDGAWIDKSYLVQLAGERCGRVLAWHKIACRKPPGTLMFGRPGYTHVLCLAHAPRREPDGLPDVFAAGTMTWTRAMGVDACRLACTYIQRHTTTRTVVDPFCGRGTVLAAANAAGLAAIGVDLSAKRCRAAERLTLDP